MRLRVFVTRLLFRFRACGGCDSHEMDESADPATNNINSTDNISGK